MLSGILPVSVLLLSSLSLSSSTTSSSSSSSTSDNPPEPSRSPTQTVAVGKGSFTFNPDTITADKGDEIVFEFWSDGHSIARSQFGYPCMPYEYVVSGGIGFWTGEMPHVNTSSPPTYSIVVNDTEPIFFYCAAPGSCKENKMIGVINANDSWTLDEQKALITNDILDLSPNDLLPSESGSSPSATATATSPTPSTSTTTTTTPEPATKHAPNLSTGETAGIAIGSVAVLLLIGATLYFRSEAYRRERERIYDETIERNYNIRRRDVTWGVVAVPGSGSGSGESPASPLQRNDSSAQWSSVSDPNSRASTRPYCRGGGISPEVCELGGPLNEVSGSLVPVELPADGHMHGTGRS